MMARNASLAERYRAHGEAFRLALELGCTPREAECELERRAAHARWEETRNRLAARMNAAPRAQISAPMPDRDGPARNEPWMMRD